MSVRHRQRKHKTNPPSTRRGEGVGACPASTAVPLFLSCVQGMVSSARGSSGDRREILIPVLTHQGSSVGKAEPAEGGAVNEEGLGHLREGSASPVTPLPLLLGASSACEMQPSTASLPRPTHRPAWTGPQPPSPRLPAEPWHPSALEGSLIALSFDKTARRGELATPLVSSLLPSTPPTAPPGPSETPQAPQRQNCLPELWEARPESSLPSTGVGGGFSPSYDLWV